MSALALFASGDWSVRAEVRDGEPWFVARDVCAAVEIAKPRDAVAKLPAEERVSMIVDTPGGPQTMTAVNEPGLYRAGRACVIHAPSDHHMADWPIKWRSDLGCVERCCPHGIGHPDPDDVRYLRSVGLGARAVHGCDGCCIAEASS